MLSLMEREYSMLNKMRDELVYIPTSETERVENVKTYCMLLSEFNHAFKIIVIYNTERKGKKISASFSLEVFCVL